MTTTYDNLMQLDFPDVHDTYSERDTMFYALSLGVGNDPVDPNQLRQVYEKNLCPLPTMCVTLAHPGFWPKELNTGLDHGRIVHGGQQLRLHKEMPSCGEVIGRSKIRDVIDKGEGRGALVYFRRELYLAESNELLCSMEQTLFCRGDGGMGGSGNSINPSQSIPSRKPDYEIDHELLPQSALLYRLNGDMNLLHADPDIARKAGFDRPIMQGLATYGVAGLALIETLCENKPAALKGLNVRFTAPVYPGESLCTQIWQLDGGAAAFRVSVPKRNVVAIDNGRADLGLG
ncbi:MAG: MaoC/PaaZ C-terminal domain-containing protein [Arenicella sp.]|nr:MaoC/PaaZ C-terminal domain-containing protein [Arenicella sp.]